jgi:aminomethyltransferase
MSSPDLSDCKRTPLFGAHVALGARMVPFGGWAMPVQYSGILAEHAAVRERVGLFDVSHMGEFLVEGPGALAFLQRVTSNDVSLLEDGQAQYSTFLLPSGGIVDDLLVYKRGNARYLLCVNASRIPDDWAWITENHRQDDRCTLVNASDDYAQVAIQGRHAAAIVGSLSPVDVAAIGTYRFVEGQAAGVPAIVARTGYTGEDGFELFVSAAAARNVWDAVMEAGRPHGLVPVGLGARDTLRLEMKYCLYGNDIDATTSPLEARLGWITKLDKGEFIGREALLRQKEQGVPRALVGFDLKERAGIARHGAPVWVDGQPNGTVTSGAMAPSLGRPIGLCYLPAAHARVGSRFEVELRGRRVPAEVVKTPFYQRPY